MRGGKGLHEQQRMAGGSYDRGDGTANGQVGQ